MFAQNSSDRISITFERVSIKDALISLEEASSYDFYFYQDWFDTSLISKSFQEETIDNVLEEILKETSINFFIYGNRVILSNNNAIIDKLPNGFFRLDSLKENKGEFLYDKIPLLQKQYGVAKNIKESDEVFYIGKEGYNVNKNLFILEGLY